MSKKMPPLGTAEWAKHIFDTPAVRNLKGRSKHTQYHEMWVPSSGRFMGSQGRLESSALHILEYLHKLNHIGKFKEQPFKTSKSEFEIEIVPDFLAEEIQTNKNLVIEIKTERFVTRIVQNQLDLNLEKFSRFGLSYLVWTDKHPLSRSVRHNIINMRRCGNTVPIEEQNSLADFVSQIEITTVGDIYKAGFDMACIFAAAWACKVFMPIHKDLDRSTVVSQKPRDNLPSFFLEKGCHLDDWWASL